MFVIRGFKYNNPEPKQIGVWDCDSGEWEQTPCDLWCTYGFVFTGGVQEDQEFIEPKLIMKNTWKN